MKTIEIFSVPNNPTELKVQFENDNVWLSQAQMAELFARERSVITKHINNIFQEQELDEKSSVQNLHIANSDKPVAHYNLDVIISVGYRVRSKVGVAFRQWATQRLKEYLIAGVSINQKRLEELGKILSIVEQAKQQPELSDSDKNNFSEIAIRYASTFVLLSQYDANSLEINGLSEKITEEINYEEALQAIQILKTHQTVEQHKIGLFGQEVDGKFKALLGNITQTFDGQYLYPTIEEQAAHLLYFINKNHAFVDGNKRISAYMFLLFLEKNKHHLKKNKTVKINDNGLVTLTLLVAQSASEDKELIIKLILNLINTQ